MHGSPLQPAQVFATSGKSAQAEVSCHAYVQGEDKTLVDNFRYPTHQWKLTWGWAFVRVWNEATDELPGAWAAPAPGRVAGSGRGRGACKEFSAYVSLSRISSVSNDRAPIFTVSLMLTAEVLSSTYRYKKPLATSGATPYACSFGR